MGGVELKYEFLPPLSSQLKIENEGESSNDKLNTSFHWVCNMSWFWFSLNKGNGIQHGSENEEENVWK